MFPGVKCFFKAVTPVIMYTLEYLNTLHCHKSKSRCTMWCNHHSWWCWYRPTAYHSFLELTKGQLCLFYFSVWVNWKLVGDTESWLWQIRSECDESSLQWSGFGGGDFDFPVLLPSGKEPSLTWESRLSVFVYFLRAVFLLNSRRPTEVCVCVWARARVCVCVLLYSKSFLWMKWDVNLTSVQNEDVGWFSVFCWASIWPTSNIKQQNK